MTLLNTPKVFLTLKSGNRTDFVSGGMYVQYSKRKINNLVAESPHSGVRIILACMFLGEAHIPRKRTQRQNEKM